MIRLRNVSPLGALTVPALGGVVIERGDSVDVPDTLAEPLLEQTENWARDWAGDDPAGAPADVVVDDVTPASPEEG